jgi:hypothetical protein
MLYVGKKARVPEEAYAIPIGKAAIKRHGRDVTLVATMAMVDSAMQAATRLEADGIDVEVIDPRTLVPIDVETIRASVRKTGRLVIVDEGRTCSARLRHGGGEGDRRFDCASSCAVRATRPCLTTTSSSGWSSHRRSNIVEAIKSVVLRDKLALTHRFRGGSTRRLDIFAPG